MTIEKTQDNPGKTIQRTESEVLDNGAEKIFNQNQQSSNVEEKTTEKEVIYEGFGRKFVDAKELADYAKELEGRLMSNEMEKKKIEETKQKETVASNLGNNNSESVVTDEMADLIFEKPKDVLSELEKKIELKFHMKEQQKVQEKNFWDTFYTENEDLKSQKRVVDLILKEKAQVIAPMEVAKGKEFLAREARSFLQEIGKDVGTKEKLTASGTTNLGTSQFSQPKEDSSNVEASDFVSEMRSYQRKH